MKHVNMPKQSFTALRVIFNADCMNKLATSAIKRLKVHRVYGYIRLYWVFFFLQMRECLIEHSLL